MANDQYLSFQKNLELDLDDLIKTIRIRQENCYKMLECIQKIINGQGEIENNLFIHEQLHKYRQMISEIKGKENACDQQYNIVIKRYQNNCIMYQDKQMVIKRVTHRILDILYNTINTLTNKIPNLYQEYIKLKLYCLKIINEQIVNKPYFIIKAIHEHELNKNRRYAQILTEIIDLLENGDIYKIQRIYQNLQNNKFDFKNSIKIEKKNQQKSQILKETNSLFFQSGKSNRIKIKQRFNSIKEQSKNIQKTKNFLIKKAKRALEPLKDVIEINRQEFIDEFTSFMKQNKKQELMRQLISRNKVNQQNIIDFISKTSKHQHKIKLLSRSTESSEHNFPSTSNNSKIDLNFNEVNAQKKFYSARKSLLLKIKQNEYKNKHMPSQLLKKTSKLEEIRFNLKTSHKNRQHLDHRFSNEKQKLLKAIENVVYENEELALKSRIQNSQTECQKLPTLNKRAHSVDQNYKNLQEETENHHFKTLTSSIKIHEQLRKKMRQQKAEIQPSKIKIELRSANTIIFNEINKKLFKIGEFNKHLCF